MDSLTFTSEKHSYRCVEKEDKHVVMKSPLFDDGVPSLIEEIEPQPNMISCNSQLVKYAQQNNLKSSVWDEIESKDNERVFQGTRMTKSDYISEDPDIVNEKAKELCACLDNIKEIEEDSKAEIARIKNKAKVDIEAIEETIESLKEIVESGCQSVECVASWERDMVSEHMLLIRHDNGKVLDYREMNPDEKAQTDLFDTQEDTDQEAEVIDGAPLQEGDGTVGATDKVNLCDSCGDDFGTCTPGEDIEYGSGEGNDNVIRCSSFTNAEDTADTSEEEAPPSAEDFEEDENKE